MFDGPEELLEECMGPPIEGSWVPGERQDDSHYYRGGDDPESLCDVPLTSATYKKLAELCAAKEVGDLMCFMADYFMNKDKDKGNTMDQIPPFGWEVSGGVRGGCASVCKRERERERTCVCVL